MSRFNLQDQVHAHHGAHISQQWMNWLASIHFISSNGLSSTQQKNWLAAVEWNAKNKHNVTLLEWMMKHIHFDGNILSQEELKM